MSDSNRTVVVVPCSGIGKSLGTVAREAAYDLVEELRPGETRLVAVSKLVLGEAEAGAIVAAHPAITLDGCSSSCAAKMVRQSGGTLAREVSVLEVYRRHKELKPQGIAQLNPAGQRLARVLAEELALYVDALSGADGATEGNDG